MKRIVVEARLDEQNKCAYVARAEGSKKEVVADSYFAAQLYAAKVHLGIRRPRKVRAA